MKNIYILLFCVLSGACLGITSALVMGAPTPMLFGSLVGGVLALLCSPVVLLKRHHPHIFSILCICFVVSMPVAALSGLTANPKLAIALTAAPTFATFYLLVRQISTDEKDLFRKTTIYMIPVLSVLIAVTFGLLRRVPDDISSLVEMMGSKDMQLQMDAANKLMKYGKDPFMQALKHKNAGVRARAAQFLGLLGDPRVLDAVISATKDPDAHVRMWAAFSLGRIGDRSALPILDLLSRDDEEIVRRQAMEAAQAIKESGRP